MKRTLTICVLLLLVTTVFAMPVERSGGTETIMAGGIIPQPEWFPDDADSAVIYWTLVTIRVWARQVPHDTLVLTRIDTVSYVADTIIYF